MIDKNRMMEGLKALPADERSREYEKAITKLADSYNSPDGIDSFTEIMNSDSEYSYSAFFCLATIFRHNRDYTKLSDLLEMAENREGFDEHVSLKHIRIMYETHSESLYDYDELLKLSHESACELYDNSGYQHTFANAFATICDNCLLEDLDQIIETWYDAALFCVNRAIELDPKYAKFYCTKARIIARKQHFEEANRLILRAIDLEDSSNRNNYAINIGYYQYYRTMIAIQKQNWMHEKDIYGKQFNKEIAEADIPKGYNDAHRFAFASYSHGDSMVVYDYIRRLIDAGVNIWYDREIPGGEQWEEIVGEHILNCDVVLFFISQTSILSKNVRNEIRMAARHGKKLIPIFIEEVDLTPGAELQLRGYQWYYAYKISKDGFISQVLSDLMTVRSEKGNYQREMPAESVKQSVPGGGSGIIIEESLCKGKTEVEDENEDIIVINDKFIAVIDGATSKSDTLIDGKKEGRISSEFLRDFIINELPDSIDGKTAVARMQAAMKNYSEKNHFKEKGIHLCASAVIFSVMRNQIWSVGDCQFMLDGQRYTFTKKVDEVMSQLRSLLVNTLICSGKTEEELLSEDTARNQIIDELKMQRFLENTNGEFGYSVFSDHGDIQDVFILDVKPGSEVILASDGYPVLWETLQKSEDSLRDLLETDPLCYKKIKSTKGLTRGNQSFDDRSYIRFWVNN